MEPIEKPDWEKELESDGIIEYKESFKNKQGIPYTQLLSEESKFHDCSIITAMDCLNTEIQTIIPDILTDPNCPEIFIDELEAKHTILEAHKIKITTAFEKELLDLEEYLKIVNNCFELHKIVYAESKNSSHPTKHRIFERIKLIATEITTLKAMILQQQKPN